MTVRTIIRSYSYVKNRIVWLVFTGTLLFFFCSHTTPYSAGRTDPAPKRNNPDSLVQRLILIGDTGEPEEDVLSSLYRAGVEDSSKTNMIFLGDNVYPHGLTGDNQAERKKYEKRLQVQLEMVQKSGVKGIFIPGNHDWARGGESGKAAVLRQEKMVESCGNIFLPDGGCPGPVALDFQMSRLIILDTDYWINDKIEWSGDCAQAGPELFLVEFEKLMKNAGERYLILLAHHPLDTYGPHGGFFDWQDHLFPLTRLNKWMWLPLPGLGSLYPLGREYLVKSNQDLVSENYRHMVETFRKTINSYHPLIYASGHDHSLQVLQGDSVQYLLVAGAGSGNKITPVSHGENTLFAYSHTGFMILDFLADKTVILRVIESPGNRVLYRKELVSP